MLPFSIVEYRKALEANRDYSDRRSPFYVGSSLRPFIREVRLAHVSATDFGSSGLRQDLFYLERSLAGGCHEFMKGWTARLAGQKNLVAGLAMGVAGVLLAYLGNPRNTGICVSCFAENVAGSLRLHGDPRMTYLRPEFMGFLLGATAMALGRGKFRPRGGSSPFIRFLVGILLIVGSTIFLGCPIKVVLRTAAGDVTALPAVAGLVGGVWLGVLFLRRGFFLGKGVKTRPMAGWILPSFMVLLTAGAEHAPLLASLGLGGVVGALSQRSSFCVTVGLRNFFLTRDVSMVAGVGIFLLSALAMNLALGLFQPGLYNQPGSHLACG